MSLLINEAYANPAQPLWQPVGTGLVGPTGPTGTTGPTGPAGPPGIDSDVQVLSYDPYLPGGLPLDIGGGPTYTTTSTVTITPLVNGKLFMEAFCRYVNGGPVGASAVLTFKVNGLLINDVVAVTQAYAGNINFLNSSCWQIPCTAGTPYTIEAVGQSTHFSGASDNVVLSSRLWCFASQ